MTMPVQYIGTDVPSDTQPDSSSVRKFPQTPLKKTNKVSTTTEYSVLSTTTVQNCQELTNDPMLRNHAELIRQQYEETIGKQMPMSFLRQLLRDLIAGTPWQYYEYALEETAYAPQPSWRYTMAIVNRLRSCCTPIDRIREPKPAALSYQGYSQRRDKFPGYPGATVSEQCYTQREYTNSDDALDRMMAEFLAKQEKAEAVQASEDTERR